MSATIGREGRGVKLKKRRQGAETVAKACAQSGSKPSDVRRSCPLRE
ncbi:MAG TPA: hypothetical protein VN044_02795 [Verrucomicrobiae bacterium]|nr:hypothetical protein [Verrucomicrobiae bacterium]